VFRHVSDSVTRIDSCGPLGTSRLSERDSTSPSEISPKEYDPRNTLTHCRSCQQKGYHFFLSLVSITVHVTNMRPKMRIFFHRHGTKLFSSDRTEREPSNLTCGPVLMMILSILSLKRSRTLSKTIFPVATGRRALHYYGWHLQILLNIVVTVIARASFALFGRGIKIRVDVCVIKPCSSQQLGSLLNGLKFPTYSTYSLRFLLTSTIHSQQ
jgi:hypothetical protein